MSKPTMLLRIRTATSTGASPGIDYSQPEFDEDWLRSRQKLTPLLAHGVERPADATDITAAHTARHRHRLERRILRSLLLELRQALRQGLPRLLRPPLPLRLHTTQAPSSHPLHPQQPPERLLRLQWLQPTARLAWLPSPPTLPTRLALLAWLDQLERLSLDRGLLRRHSAALADLTGTNEARRRMVALKHILNVPISTLTTLAIKPGEPHFVLWFFILLYFPVITACIGPMANMILVIGLIQHWRVDAATGDNIPDTGVPFAFNILLLVLGMAGNILLLMNFSGRVRYLVTQLVLILCWAVACAVLVTALAITKVRFLLGPVELHPGHPVVLVPLEGYWYAVFTAGLYLVCCLILLVNFLGYRLRKYPPTFNLGPKQRLLMIFTIVFAVWLLAGALLFAHMIPDLLYGLLLYFCTVLVLTIGLGDILPRSPGAKVLVLLFLLVGVLIMGLIITMVRQVVLALGGPTIFWHQIERDRVKALRRWRGGAGGAGGDPSDVDATPAAAFREMRRIRRHAKVSQGNVLLVLTVLNFMVFWLVGATVFYFTEGWSYFNAVYFCFLCLITIGYGDFAPTLVIGRPFFVCWGIGAIPLMTILISNVGDKLYALANHTSVFLAKWFFPDYYRYLRDKRVAMRRERALRRAARAGPDPADEIYAEKEGDAAADDDEDDRDGQTYVEVLNDFDNTRNLDLVEEQLRRADEEKGRRRLILPWRTHAEALALAPAMQALPDVLPLSTLPLSAPLEASEGVPNRLQEEMERDLGLLSPLSEGHGCPESDEAGGPRDQSDPTGGFDKGASRLSDCPGDAAELCGQMEVTSSGSDKLGASRLGGDPGGPRDPPGGLDGPLRDYLGPTEEDPGAYAAGADAVYLPQSAFTTEDRFQLAMQYKMEHLHRHVEKLQGFVDHLKPLVVDSIDEPTKRYSHEEWETLLGLLHDSDGDSVDPSSSEYYWLSESSPLRLPLNEPNYLMMKFIVRMEIEVRYKLAADVRDLERTIRESTSLRLQR